MGTLLDGFPLSEGTEVGPVKIAPGGAQKKPTAGCGLKSSSTGGGGSGGDGSDYIDNVAPQQTIIVILFH